MAKFEIYHFNGSILAGWLGFLVSVYDRFALSGCRDDWLEDNAFRVRAPEAGSNEIFSLWLPCALQSPRITTLDPKVEKLVTAFNSIADVM